MSKTVIALDPELDPFLQSVGSYLVANDKFAKLEGTGVPAKYSQVVADFNAWYKQKDAFGPGELYLENPKVKEWLKDGLKHVRRLVACLDNELRVRKLVAERNLKTAKSREETDAIDDSIMRVSQAINSSKCMLLGCQKGLGEWFVGLIKGYKDPVFVNLTAALTDKCIECRKALLDLGLEEEQKRRIRQLRAGYSFHPSLSHSLSRYPPHRKRDSTGCGCSD